MTSLSRFKAVELIRSTNGQIFSCVFRKKDKTLRHMVCLLPVVKKNAKRASPAKPNNSFVLVRDLIMYNRVLKATSDAEEAHKLSYRLINLATLEELTINKIDYLISD